MLDTTIFISELNKWGYRFFSGVPCSYLAGLINGVMNECAYIMAANEGDAVAISSGSYLGGQKSVVFMQNSGLTNAISPLTSLNYNFKIPVLGFVSLRGDPDVPDEPQHELMGTITEKMLDLMGIQWAYLADNFDQAKEQLAVADTCISQNYSFFFVVKKDTFNKVVLNEKYEKSTPNRIIQPKSLNNEIKTRLSVLERLNQLKNNNTVLLATTGKTGRELYEIGDNEQHFYMVGSMGCVSSIGLGLAMSKPNKDIVAIDGDGALLMRMGSLATNAYYYPVNMLHILLDNNCHDSTGGQQTLSHNVDFVAVAADCGYARSIYIHSLDELALEFKKWQSDKALTFFYLKIEKGSKKELGRPHIKPYEVKERLMNFLNR